MNYPTFLDSIVSGSMPGSRLRSLFFDGVTGLPTLSLMMESVKDAAIEYQRLGILFLRTDSLEHLELEFGWELVDQLMALIPSFLDSVASDFHPLKMFAIHRLPGDDLILFVYSSDPSQPLQHEQLSAIAQNIGGRLSEYLARRVEPGALSYVRVYTGFSSLNYNAAVRFDRLVSRAINKAFQGAVSQEQTVKQAQIDRLHEILGRDQLRILFQPIFNLQDYGQILGHEALSRGPAGTLFDKSEFMFSLAGECGLLFQLENLCQMKLIDKLKDSVLSSLIFVNLEPSFLEENRYAGLALFRDSIDAGKFVFEITERIAINDYKAIASALGSLRAKGFRIAVDDVGSGYASLQSIAYLKPDFIKINEKMVQGIAGDYIKQEIVRTLKDLSSRLSAVLIAEGIEEEADLQMLKKLGISFGQGFLLKRPEDRLLP